MSSCTCDYGGYKQGCRLLSDSHIGHNVIRKEENKEQTMEYEVVFEKKKNISCDAHLRDELLETDVPGHDAIVVSAGKLRKL